MATQYSKIFTLKDIFNNKALKGKLPLINYREIERENGTLSRRTSPKSVGRLVYDTSVSAARPFYRPILPSKSGDVITIGGTLVGDIDEAVEAVYSALNQQRLVLTYTANNADMIRDALKESEKNARSTGQPQKLYLRAKSMHQIETMSNREIQALLNDVMENIMYGEGFSKTQKKWGVEERLANLSYNQRKIRWRYKVGDIQ